MRALLDVNVLIALLDPDHVAHAPAIAWFSRHARRGWASCPITQNGCVRVMSQPGYPGTPPLQLVCDRLGAAIATDLHEFWADDISLLNGDLFDRSRLHGPRQITDCYLLALAVQHGGALATLDRSIARDAVRGASDRHLIRI